MEKPESMVLATKLLWISLGICALSAIFNASKAGPMGLVFAVIVIFFTLLILGLIFWQIAAGKNWARITFAVLYGIGLLPSIALLFTGAIMREPVTIIVMLIQTAIQGYALYLTFTKPGSDWFSSAAKEPAQNIIR